MTLAKYKQKRRFDQTPEPEGRVRQKADRKLEFVVQKHRASHLHYDFRLELEGVLKSWAVPKGPSLNPEDKRLAMMVEDHPYEYRKFEGTIPKGNYGAGEVIVWDRGTYEPTEKTDEPEDSLKRQLDEGQLKIILHGEKLRGEFALIKTQSKGDNAWLLIKKKDSHSSDEDIASKAYSVVSQKLLPEDRQRINLNGARKTSIPREVKPMLATLTADVFNDSEWIYEVKWDGYRAIGSWDGKTPELYSRNGNDFKEKYPSIVEALRNLKHQVVIDGEVAAVDEAGKTVFGWLQNRSKEPKGRLIYYAFDTLWIDGYNLTDMPLFRRKEILKQVLEDKTGTIRYSDHIEGQGKAFLKLAMERKLEGVVAKNSTSKYVQGVRSKQWLKIKTHLRQEAVIGGFTEPRGSRQHLGALILGVYEQDKLLYIGHTGGGIPVELMPDLRKRLEGKERKTSPFSEKVNPNASVHWVEPELVCEVKFSEWTDDGHMRHPVFIGLRPDKSPSEVVREMPESPRNSVGEKDNVGREEAGRINSRVNFSHLDKIFFPERGYTKGELISYYQRMGERMLTYIKDRPHTLLRHPNGIHGSSFFQKDVDSVPPEWVRTEAVYSQSNHKDIRYLVCDSLDSLLYMVQLGCIEINPWNSRVGYLNNPDWLVLDLDPEDIGFEGVVSVAQVAREVLDELKIPSYPKTSGKTGLHVFIPLNAKYDYDQTKQLAEILANLVHRRIPEISSVERSPKKRRGKVYVDFLQNRKGQTLAAPYSVRPTTEATVSTPLHWEEVNKKLRPDNFTIKNIFTRLERVGELWCPVGGEGIDIRKVLARLE